jgi:hypothetical protein
VATDGEAIIAPNNDNVITDIGSQIEVGSSTTSSFGIVM